MCETIILSCASLLIGAAVGVLIAYKALSNPINTITTPSGNKIQMWKSIISPGVTYVACNMGKDDEWLDGDCVSFDKDGRIDYISTSSMIWRREEE